MHEASKAELSEFIGIVIEGCDIIFLVKKLRFSLRYKLQ